MTELTLVACFITGLVSTLHCWGMCGGITTLLVTQTSQAQNKAFNLSALYYNLGRIFSYALIGLLAGIFSQFSSNVFFFNSGHIALQIFSSLILILIAMKILGRFVLLDFIENHMRIIWAPMQKVLATLLPAQTPIQQFSVGMIWGWLPCGMVYSILLLALASGNAIDSMLYLLCFGIGTLPGMFSLGLGADSFLKRMDHQSFRYVSAAIIILIALWQPLNWLVQPEAHHQHEHHHHH